MTTNYNESAISQLFSKYHIIKTQVAKSFGQTNNLTVERWIAGKDIYVMPLIRLCNLYNLDLLSMFTHDGKPFRTTLLDIAMLEDNNISVQDVLREHDIEPSTNIRTLSDAVNNSGFYLSPSATESQQAARTVDSIENTLNPGDIIDRFIEMQTKAYAHEQQSLERQRTDMQAIIDRQDGIISELKKKLSKYEKGPNVGFAASRIAIVNDDSNPDYGAPNAEQ